MVLAIAYARKLELQELWIAFGVGNHFRYLPIHKITTSLTQQQCEALPFFHAVTGCDTVSYSAGKGKKTAFQAWKSNPEVTETFRVLSSPQDTVYEEQCHALERFVVVMCSRTCPHQTVNEARQVLFAQGNKSIENIPPTQAALAQHIKRAAYQAGHVWVKRWGLCRNSQVRQSGVSGNHQRDGLPSGLCQLRHQRHAVN